MAEAFRKFASKVSEATGSAWAFIAAVAIVVVWAITGPLFHYSEVWQLVINTGTTIVTFLMVFLLQNSTNRESKANSVRLDELIRATENANNHLIGLETKTDQEITKAAEEIKETVEQSCDSSP